MLKKKIFAIGLAAGAGLSFLIALAVYTLYEPPRPYELPSLAEEPPAGGITAYEFALPDELERFLSPRPRYFREPGSAWMEDDSREFRIDPRELAAGVLIRQNRKKLDDIFERVP
ncbi:MAG: hypothetical protein LBQ57_01605 [Spirochaetales bacterium]|jgi:hypothetical protein|nr:hypothetical protein [Spirochaetales bacterium]